MPPASDTSRALLRFCAAAILATGVALAFQDRIVGALLPVFRDWLGAIDHTYRTVSLSIVAGRNESFISRTAETVAAHVIGKDVVYAGTRLENRAAAGIVLQPVVLLVALLAAYPWKSGLELVVRFLCGALLAGLVLLLDVPMMLYGFAWNSELEALAAPDFSPLVTWADCMNAGGRFVLTLSAGVAAVYLGRLSSGAAPGNRTT